MGYEVTSEIRLEGWVGKARAYGPTLDEAEKILSLAMKYLKKDLTHEKICVKLSFHSHN